MDIYSIDKRKEIMAKVHSRNTKPEVFVRKFLFNKGFRYKLHVNKLPGSPDIVLPRYKTAVFVHGCFWHGHKGCSFANLPKSNTDFWRKKQITNQLRDFQKEQQLLALGWFVETIWECELRNSITSYIRLTNLINSLTLREGIKID